MPGAGHLLNLDLVGVGWNISKLQIDNSYLGRFLDLIVSLESWWSRDRVIAREHGLLSSLGVPSRNSERRGFVFLCCGSALGRGGSLFTNDTCAHEIALLLIGCVVIVIISSRGLETLYALFKFSICLPALGLGRVRMACIVHVNSLLVDRSVLLMIGLLKNLRG